MTPPAVGRHLDYAQPERKALRMQQGKEIISERAEPQLRALMDLTDRMVDRIIAAEPPVLDFEISDLEFRAGRSAVIRSFLPTRAERDRFTAAWWYAVCKSAARELGDRGVHVELRPPPPPPIEPHRSAIADR